ncbi:MAG: seryl-tRNA synthetase, seryl-tRNA synthetase [Candidatus Peregrinibacteria bacterium GW2011_GWE2_39_6]|nr:MAG: seryl-tRNA synthetase, seryl-tRNA synthetase [Candidatus Peregrinibacteria bacterium GW2011_GWF2_39_17]KKR24942.1 MAG: seryl-tRNA synthetase, seryl-tRNA synthetase [Candidatus Peregrinibacteria bacterium GW2011_GWE2_39_6]
MLDLNLFRENPDRIRADLKKRGMDCAKVDQLIQLDKENRELLQEIENERAIKNNASTGIAKMEGDEKKHNIEVMQLHASQEKVAKGNQQQIEKKLLDILLTFPNITHSSTPEGPDESGNVVEKKHGEPRQFDFKPKDHIELGTSLNILNLEDATRMSGTRFAYLLKEGALLEFALLQFVMQKLVSKGFTPVIPPVLVREHAMIATGFFPADRNEIYHVNPKLNEDDKENDDLYLVGTSEVPLTMLHADKILDEEKLPLRYVGFSTCFRREAGSYGKDTQGIIRVHQFDKIEMFSFCHPEKSWQEHDFIRSIEEEIMQDLGLAYQVLNICSGDLGYPASKKYDIEAWIPTQQKYRELTSCSNCTDYQARRAKIRYKSTKTGKNEFIHTLNGTACAMGRTIVAILENYQQANGSIEVPKALRPFMDGLTKITTLST